MLAGLILAGGEGRRFGGPKAWARLPDGRTFLEGCARTLAGVGASPIVATLPPGADDSVIDGLELVVLPEPGMDMFGSLRTGLSRLIEDPGWRRVAVLPVDHPLVDPKTVQALAVSNERAVIPSYKGKHGHPICLDRDIASAIAGGEFGGPTLREVLREVGAVGVDVSDRAVVANCNTPAALSEALKAANFEF